MVLKYITLYYDDYEKKYGDGFYPSTLFEKGYESLLTGFKNANGYWIQISGDPITGFDGNEKNNVLKLLNDEIFQSKHILNRQGFLI